MNQQETKTILVIEDELYIRLNICELLEDDGYLVIQAENGQKGIDILKTSFENIDLVLCDILMPEIDGYGVLTWIKSNVKTMNLPFIFLTALADQDNILNGIQTGAYYYLTKPYESDVLLALIRNALNDAENLKYLRDEIDRERKIMLELIQECHFTLQTIDEARCLLPFLANFFPDPNRVILGLSELIINAIEHGNLGIGYTQKSYLVKNNLWEEEIRRRSSLEENQDKFVHIEFSRNPEWIHVQISDDGEGFNFDEYLELNADRAFDVHGRGIVRAKTNSFDEIIYHEKGNKVSLLVRNDYLVR